MNELQVLSGHKFDMFDKSNVMYNRITSTILRDYFLLSMLVEDTGRCWHCRVHNNPGGITGSMAGSPQSCIAFKKRLGFPP